MFDGRPARRRRDRSRATVLEGWVLPWPVVAIHHPIGLGRKVHRPLHLSRGIGGLISLPEQPTHTGRKPEDVVIVLPVGRGIEQRLRVVGLRGFWPHSHSWICADYKVSGWAT